MATETKTDQLGNSIRFAPVTRTGKQSGRELQGIAGDKSLLHQHSQHHQRHPRGDKCIGWWCGAAIYCCDKKWIFLCLLSAHCLSRRCPLSWWGGGCWCRCGGGEGAGALCGDTRGHSSDVTPVVQSYPPTRQHPACTSQHR